MNKSNVLDMTHGDIIKQIIMFAIPILAGNLFQELYSVIDTIIIGKTLGVEKLAAVGSTGPLLFFVISFIIGLSGGCAVITSQRFGAEDAIGIKKSMTAHMIIALIMALITTAIITANVEFFLTLLKTNADIFNHSYIYVLIMFAGMPGVVLYNCFSSSLRAVGDSKTPLYFIALSTLLNIALDFLFILYFHWDVAGAAWATILSEAISGLLCGWVIWKRTPILVPDRQSFKNLWPIIWSELKIGIPMGVQFSVIALGFMVLQYVLNSFGSIAVAAFTVGSRIQSLMINPIASMSVVMATYVGQNYGAQKWDRIIEGMRKSLTYTAIFTICMGGIIWLLCNPIINLFIQGQQDEVVKLARQFLGWSCPLVWTLTFVFLTRGALQGLGDGITPMFGGFLELIMRVSIPLGCSISLGYTAVCIASPAAWISCGVMMTTIFAIRMNRIKKNKLSAQNITDSLSDPKLNGSIYN